MSSSITKPEIHIVEDSKYDQIHFEVKQPTKIFSGRENELCQLKDTWEKCLKRKLLTFATITGMSGVGKTELVKHFIKKFESGIPNCIWINGTTSETIFSDFRRLAFQFSSIRFEPHVEITLANLVERIYNKLSNKKCIIIIDNMDTYEESILKMLVNVSGKRRPQELRPFVIITSKNSSVKKHFGNKAEQIHLDMLTLKEGIELVSMSFNIEKEDHLNFLNSKSLCERLSCLPLALRQAIYYMKANFPKHTLSTKFENIFSLLDGNIKTVLQFQLSERAQEGFDNTVYLSWMTSLKKIAEIQIVGEMAIVVLKIAAFLYWENISFSLINDIISGFPESKKVKGNINTQDAFHLLCNYSMCTFNKMLEAISINPLIQEVMKAYLMEEKTYEDTLDAVLHSLRNSGMRENFCSSTNTHVKYLIRHAVRNAELLVKYKDFIASHDTLCTGEQRENKRKLKMLHIAPEKAQRSQLKEFE